MPTEGGMWRLTKEDFKAGRLPKAFFERLGRDRRAGVHSGRRQNKRRSDGVFAEGNKDSWRSLRRGITQSLDRSMSRPLRCARLRIALSAPGVARSGASSESGRTQARLKVPILLRLLESRFGRAPVETAQAASTGRADGRHDEVARIEADRPADV